MPYELVEAPTASPSSVTGGFEAVDTPPGSVTPGATLLDRIQAASAGLTRGAITNLPGMPVDTALNVADLARAAYGYGGSKLGFFSAGDAPQLLEREKYPGSSEWIAKQEREKLALGPSIDPNRPDDLISRLAFAGGQGVAPAMIGGAATSPGRALAAGTAGAATQVASQGAQEAGLPPSMQVLASFGPALISPAVSVLAEQSRQRFEANQARKATARQNFDDASKAGFVFPPAQSNPTVTNKVLGGFGGKVATQQDAAMINKEVAGDLSRQAIGLPADSPIGPAVTSTVRENAYINGYEPVKQFGALGIDKQYLRDINSIESGYVNSKGDFETLRVPAVEALIKDVKNNIGLDGASAVQLIRTLRNQASANLSNAIDPQAQATGLAQKKVAIAMEDLIGRNLDTAGQPEALANFRQARKTIAQTHTVDEITDPLTEDVDARKAYVQLRGGVPLEGPLLLVAKGGAFGGPAAKVNTTGGGGATVMDTLPMAIGGVGGALIGQHTTGDITTGGLGGALAGSLYPLARHAVRAGMLSGPYQQFMAQPSNTLGALTRLAEMSPEARQLIGSFAIPAQDATQSQQ